MLRIECLPVAAIVKAECSDARCGKRVVYETMM